jgi:predicted DNA-binding transcriptional regulator AlpA
MTKPKKFLRRRQLAERYSVHERSADRMVRDGRLPKPVYRGKTPFWDEDELDASDRACVVAESRA